MTYRVVKDTHLFVDRKEMQKKGDLTVGTLFESAGWDVAEDGKAMVKTNAIDYVHKGVAGNGDGWIRGEDVEKIVADEPPSGGTVPVVLKAGRYRISGEVLVEEIAD